MHNKDSLYSVSVYQDISCSPYYTFNVLIFGTYNIGPIYFFLSNLIDRLL